MPAGFRPRFEYEFTVRARDAGPEDVTAMLRQLQSIVGKGAIEVMAPMAPGTLNIPRSTLNVAPPPVLSPGPQPGSVPCGCGCGEMVEPKPKGTRGRARRFVNHSHYLRWWGRLEPRPQIADGNGTCGS